MNKSGDFVFNGNQCKAKSFNFGGKSGMKAILQDPTGVSAPYKGSIYGDLEVTILDDYWITDLFNSQTTQPIGDKEFAASLRVMKISEKGKFLGSVEFEFLDVSLLSLRKSPDPANKDRIWMILEICFDSVKVTESSK